jgi:hypothetical protein
MIIERSIKSGEEFRPNFNQLRAEKLLLAMRKFNEMCYSIGVKRHMVPFGGKTRN